MSKPIRSAFLRAIVPLLFATAAPVALAQLAVPITNPPGTETFDTLANSGATNTLVPDGWYFVETGTNANTTYAADNGTANSGNTYSFGAIGSTDRAFGGLQSGSLVPMIGAQLRNDTAAALSEIAVSYTGEQWRLGALGRVDRLDFQYSINATSLSDTVATWTPVAALSFTAPVTGPVTGALDGNAAANRTAISGSITGLNLPVGGTIWVRWVDFNATGNDDSLAIDDVTFAPAGAPPVDLPPTVTSTNPGQNASNVPVAASLVVNFSEPVTVVAPWFTLNCTVSGSHTATVSAGPQSYTLTPSPAFALNENCTWTILASGVTDIDGTPQPMAADYVVPFTTASTTGPPGPSLIWSLPSSGATRVPRASDLRLTFDVAATVTGTPFALSCNGTPIALTVVGNNPSVNRTLVPVTVMPVSGSCVLSIDAAGVTNGTGTPMSAPVSIPFTIDGPYAATAYYGQVNDSDFSQLRCSLHATIRGHTFYPYSGGAISTWSILEAVQAMPGDASKVIDVYRNRAYNVVSDRAGTGSGITYNREHTWPNSLGFPSDTGNLGRPNAPYTDTHMLWLSDTQWNADRGNKPFGYCDAACGERLTESNGGVGGGTGLYPGNSNWVRSPDGNQGTFEVWNHRKGEMARAIFYMAIRYEGGTDPLSGQTEPQLELTDVRSQIGSGATSYMGLLTDLLAWHVADPPDAAEIARNNAIHTFQGNRNPFVDHPEWATRGLFESTAPATCQLASTDVIFANGFDSATP